MARDALGLDTPAPGDSHRLRQWCAARPGRVSLFSGLNNLQDITLDARWSALCGDTDEDVDTVFAPELPGRCGLQIRANGHADKYRGRGEPIHLVGVAFSRDSRNIVGFETETLHEA